jgi:hypothetical protein
MRARYLPVRAALTRTTSHLRTRCQVSPPSPRPEAQAATEGWLAAEAKLPVRLTVGWVAVAAVGQAEARAEAVAAEAGAVVEEAEVVGAGVEAEEQSCVSCPLDRTACADVLGRARGRD